MKRALLYAGITASAGDPEEAPSYLGLGIHDTELLPAEQRLVTTMALMMPSSSGIWRTEFRR